MNFGNAFVFMFEDPAWLRKLVIGTLVALLGMIFAPVLIGLIPLIVLMGYVVDVVHNVLERRQYPLPEWQDWGGFLVRGFKVVAALFIWLLPIIVVAIPLGIGSALLSNNRGAQAGGSLLVVCGSCLTILWGIFVTLITPAVFVRIAALDRFSAAFNVSEIWDFTRDNLGNVIIAVLLTWVAGLIAAVIAGVGIIACIVGLVVTIPFSVLWQYLVMGYLYGVVGAQSKTPISGLQQAQEPIPSLPELGASEGSEPAAPLVPEAPAQLPVAAAGPETSAQPPEPTDLPAPEVPEQPVEPSGPEESK